MKKTILALIIAFFLISIPVCALATTVDLSKDSVQLDMVSPRLTYISGAETVLSIDDGVATVECWVKGNVSKATKAKVIAELQVKNSATNWIPVAIWTDTQNDFMASVYETKNINTANTYRVKATYTIWEGSQSETITAFSNEM